MCLGWGQGIRSFTKTLTQRWCRVDRPSSKCITPDLRLVCCTWCIYYSTVRSGCVWSGGVSMYVASCCFSTAQGFCHSPRIHSKCPHPAARRWQVLRGGAFLVVGIRSGLKCVGQSQHSFNQKRNEAPSPKVKGMLACVTFLVYCRSYTMEHHTLTAERIPWHSVYTCRQDIRLSSLLLLLRLLLLLLLLCVVVVVVVVVVLLLLL